MNNLMEVKEKKLMDLKKNDKGFTLIEMVIVLVIIAILAAILVPSMMGWINNAKQKSFLTEARNAYTAVNSGMADVYAASGALPTALTTAGGFTQAQLDSITDKMGKTIASTDCTWVIDGTTKKMTSFTYKNSTYTAVFTVSSGTWAIT